jgi:SpoVK/Ycf46/Vps4 family AAA+-type ATPase
VPFAQYEAYMRAFAMSAPRSATRDRVREAFSRLVLNERVLGQLGPAVNGGHSMFVYGPPGNGKTVISQAIRNLLDGELPIPYALEAHGHIIQLYDADLRWVRCRRPLVMVGGELGLESLDLSYGATSKFYQAPVQMSANGGVLVIDDFGRQRCSPRDLLNRWITPLESRVDYLTLQTGQKLPMPFTVLVVFATNIKPTELVDEAFLRRIHYKVYAESPTLGEFKQIFERCCVERDVSFDESVVDQLVANEYGPRRIALRGCQPRDLISHALAFAEYLGEPARLTPPLLKMAFDTYFVDERAASAPES